MLSRVGSVSTLMETRSPKTRNLTRLVKDKITVHPASPDRSEVVEEAQGGSNLMLAGILFCFALHLLGSAHLS